MKRRLGHCAIVALMLGTGGCTVVVPSDHAGESPPSVPQSTAILPPAEPQVLSATTNATVTPDTSPPAGIGLPRSSAPPIEDIVVTAASLTGYWRLTASSSIDVEVGLLSGIRIAYSGEAHDRDICRIRREDSRLRTTCIAGFTPTAEGSVDDQRITLRWWAGPANVIFRGLWNDAETIEGAFTGGVVGISVTGDIPAVMSKVPAPNGITDDRPSAPLMQAVFADLRQGSLTDGHYEAMAAKRLQPAFSWPGAQASSHSLSYLGRIHIRWHRWQRETIQDVYDVQSPGDRSLCRIALSDRGRVVDFACQSEPE